MKFDAIYHRTSDNLCYPTNKTDLMVNIKTGYDIQKVILHYGDPFSAGILGGKEVWTGDHVEITQNKNLQYHLWWSVVVQPEFKRCKYYFELSDGKETWYYFEDGFLSAEQMKTLEKNLQCFVFPWMNESDINLTPTWVNDTIWYQIFPDRFYNGDTSNDMEGVRPWKMETAKNEYHYGGDLKGIICKLDYLEDLGITGIYLNPIFYAGTIHKYDTIDYKMIDPQFGNNEEFKKLVKGAHEHGIRVMIDGVFNHCGNRFAPWVDVLEKGPESQYYNWFMINEWPFDQSDHNTKDGKFYSFAFTSDMPKLNTNEQEVIDYFIDVCEYWVKNYDVDGLRLDVANEISHKFVRALRIKMKELKPDIYLLGEIWHDSIQWLMGDEFDAVMNYPLSNAISDFWCEKSMTKLDFEHQMNQCYSRYMEQSNAVMFQLLDSHDTERLLHRTQDMDVFYQQLVLLFVVEGSPCLYYGTEIAMEGAHDPDCRRCMPWEEMEAGRYQEAIDTVKQLIELRKQEEALRSKYITYTNLFKEERVLEFVRGKKDNSQIQVILNAGESAVKLTGEGQNIFARNCKNNTLYPKGICIRKL